MIDLLGKIKRLANKDDSETFDPSTDSLEALQELIMGKVINWGVAIIRGEVDSAAPSVTDHLVSALTDFGDDFFNDHFYMQVVRAGGAAPEGEVRLITDYVSTTGFFETDPFTANVEAGDFVAIIHESLVTLGRNDAANTFDSSLVVADEDGSLLERLQFLQEEGPGLSGAIAYYGTVEPVGSDTTHVLSNRYGGLINSFVDDFFNDRYYLQVLTGTQVGEVRLITDYDSTTATFTTVAFSAALAVADIVLIMHEAIAAIGGNRADNEYDSSTVTANEDGSLLERQEYVQEQIALGTKPIVDDTGGSAIVIPDAVRITEGVNHWRGALLLGTVGNNLGQIRPIVASAVGSVTVYPAFTNVSALNDEYLIISAWRPVVWTQQPATAVTLNAQAAGENDVLLLDTAGLTYMVNSLRLKAGDPGAETMTVRLYELINDVLTLVDSYDIDAANWGSYHSLMDMFGEHHLAGETIRITVQMSAGADVAVTGQYQHAIAPAG